MLLCVTMLLCYYVTMPLCYYVIITKQRGSGWGHRRLMIGSSLLFSPLERPPFELDSFFSLHVCVQFRERQIYICGSFEFDPLSLKQMKGGFIFPSLALLVKTRNNRAAVLVDYQLDPFLRKERRQAELENTFQRIHVCSRGPGE